MSTHVDYSALLWLLHHRQQQVRQQKVTQIIHLQMRLEIIARSRKRMERHAGIINENIHFAVVALWNWIWEFMAIWASKKGHAK